MALVSIGSHFWPQPLGASAVGTAILLDANNETAWATHSIQRSGGGSIRYIHSRTGTVTTGGTADVRVESPDASGNPSGSLWATNTNGTETFSTSNTLYRTQLTADAAVAMGDTIIVMVQVGASRNFNINRSPMTVVTNRAFPYPGGPTTTTKIDNSGSPFAIEYSDGAIENHVGGIAGAVTPSSLSVNTGTTPDEVGILFTVPIACRCIGWWAYMAVGANADYDIRLYDVSNTVLASTTMTSVFSTSTAFRLYSGQWDNINSGVLLVPGQSYRVVILPTTANTVICYRFAAYNNAFYDSLGLPGAQETTRVNAGSWTEVSAQRFQCGIVIDAIDNGGPGPLIHQVASRVLPLY